jgi:hypothetical protein
MQPVPALDVEGVVAELLEAGGAPDVGRHVELVGQHLLRVERLEEDRSRGHDLHAARTG